MARDTLLAGKVAIATGASRGLGAAVVLAARDGAALEAREANISAAGERALSVPTDVADSVSVERLVEPTISVNGCLDAACNNAAGGRHPPTTLPDVSIDDYDSAIAISLPSVLLSMKYETPAMLDSGGGAVVSMASTAGLDAVAGLPGYVSSKRAVVGLTKVAALDYAARGVRVNAVAPGPVLIDRMGAGGRGGAAAQGPRMPVAPPWTAGRGRGRGHAAVLRAGRVFGRAGIGSLAWERTQGAPPAAPRSR